jgi:hypothetical protein
MYRPHDAWDVAGLVLITTLLKNFAVTVGINLLDLGILLQYHPIAVGYSASKQETE